MTRPVRFTIAALSLVVAATAPAAAGGKAVPGGSHAFGASAVTWQERWMQWGFGSSANPLMSDACGEEIGGVFFLNAAVEPGIKEVDCEIPPGTPLLGVPAGAIAWAPTDGETPEQLLASLDSFLSGVIDIQATLDGHPLALEEAPRLTGVYTLLLEPGNFIQTVDGGVPGDETQVASGVWLAPVNPLTPGPHELVFADLIDGVGVFEIRFHIVVR